MGKARDFKFGVRIDLQACKPNNAKAGQKGRGLRHVIYFYNFGTPLYLWNRQSEKLQIWCAVGRRAFKPKMQK